MYVLSNQKWYSFNSAPREFAENGTSFLLDKLYTVETVLSKPQAKQIADIYEFTFKGKRIYGDVAIGGGCNRVFSTAETFIEAMQASLLIQLEKSLDRNRFPAAVCSS